jgi:hypothetical protein
MNPTSTYVGLPIPVAANLTDTKYFFQALDNFSRVMAIRPGDRVLMLADPLLDPRVIDAVIGIAKSRGAEVRIYMEPSTQVTAVPEEVHAMLKKATFVVSTWFCSILDPLCINLRRGGQRWVKITYFRNLDLLHTPQARFRSTSSARSSAARPAATRPKATSTCVLPTRAAATSASASRRRCAPTSWPPTAGAAR